MRVASFFDALQEFSASVEGDNVEKIAISEGFTRIFNIYCVCLCVCVCVCVCVCDGEITQLWLFNFRSYDCKRYVSLRVAVFALSRLGN